MPETEVRTSGYIQVVDFVPSPGAVLTSTSPPRVGPAEGRKNDQDKLRFDLIPVRSLEKVAEVYTIGAKKYDDNNWRKGLKWGRVFAAMMRHAWAWMRGEKNDPKDGQHHLASVVWCALTLMEYEETHPELDDRADIR